MRRQVTIVGFGGIGHHSVGKTVGFFTYTLGYHDVSSEHRVIQTLCSDPTSGIMALEPVLTPEMSNKPDPTRMLGAGLAILCAVLLPCVVLAVIACGRWRRWRKRMTLIDAAALDMLVVDEKAVGERADAKRRLTYPADAHGRLYTRSPHLRPIDESPLLTSGSGEPIEPAEQRQELLPASLQHALLQSSPGASPYASPLKHELKHSASPQKGERHKRNLSCSF